MRAFVEAAAVEERFRLDPLQDARAARAPIREDLP